MGKLEFFTPGFYRATSMAAVDDAFDRYRKHVGTLTPERPNSLKRFVRTDFHDCLVRRLEIEITKGHVLVELEGYKHIRTKSRLIDKPGVHQVTFRGVRKVQG